VTSFKMVLTYPTESLIHNGLIRQNDNREAEEDQI
jgi:hypothetical protein